MRAERRAAGTGASLWTRMETPLPWEAAPRMAPVRGMRYGVGPPPLPDEPCMKPFAIAGFLALGCFGCTERGAGAGLASLSNYNAFTCIQLQDEADLVSREASAALGLPPRRRTAIDRNAILEVPWPDPSASGTPQARDLKARMDAVERASRAKSCAIRFTAAAG